MVNRTLLKNGRKNKNSIKVIFICLLFLTIVLLPNNSWAFYRATAKVSGIDDVFTVLRFGNNVSQSASASASTSGGAISERASFGDVYIQIALNEQIPLLFVSCADGTHIQEVTINFYEDDTDNVIYSTKISNVIVSSFDWSELLDNDSGLGVAFNYGKIEWTYGGVTAGWDLQANKNTKK